MGAAAEHTNAELHMSVAMENSDGIATSARRVPTRDVKVIGLTLSENQKQHIEDYSFANYTNVVQFTVTKN